MFSAYYQSLEEREKLVLWLGGVCALVLLAYLIWRPLSESNEHLLQQVAEKRALAAWMERAAEEVLHLQVNGAYVQHSNVPLQRLITHKTNELNLKPARMQSKGESEVQLSFDKANFNVVLTMIDRLHVDGVILKQANVRATDMPGRVKAQLTFGR